MNIDIFAAASGGAATGSSLAGECQPQIIQIIYVTPVIPAGCYFHTQQTTHFEARRFPTPCAKKKTARRGGPSLGRKRPRRRRSIDAALHKQLQCNCVPSVQLCSVKNASGDVRTSLCANSCSVRFSMGISILNALSTSPLLCKSGPEIRYLYCQVSPAQSNKLSSGLKTRSIGKSPWIVTLPNSGSPRWSVTHWRNSFSWSELTW